MHPTKLFHHKSPRRIKLPAPPEPPPPLIEPSLLYDPPYERPLEDEFAWHLIKYLRPIAGLRYQVKVETPCTHAWVDFVVEHGARRIGFEIGSLDDPDLSGLPGEDGERYRDALVIGSGALDVLYRFRAADLLYRPHDALYLAAQWDPTLFSERGKINLHTLASPEARPCRPRPHETLAQVIYEAPEVEGHVEGEAFAWPQDVPPVLVVKRLSRANPSVWMHAYDEALAHFSVPDERLEQRWAKSA